MAKYILRQPNVSPSTGYQVDSFFEASTFSELRNEIERNGASWYFGTGFHVLDENEDVLFTSEDWGRAKDECQRLGKPVLLKCVMEWASE